VEAGDGVSARDEPPREDPYWPTSTRSGEEPLSVWLPGALLLVILAIVVVSSLIDAVL